MKKSNLILLCALGMAIFFTLVFQLTVHSNVRKGKSNEVAVKTISESRDIPYFEKIVVKNRIKVIFRQNDTSSVLVEAPNYIIDSISTTLINNELVLSVSKKLKKKDSILIQIDNPILTSVKLSNNAHFDTAGKVSGKELHLELKDASSGNLSLDYENMEYINNTEGSIAIQGEIKKIALTSNTEQ
ncbi:GIN domain-containing protein [Flagellimonas sp.]|uniref:GIN domain-containing protein n=1 Tax=Flagellimonas sp. TaxID=2058762 RepID=UPI003B592FF0